MAKLIPDMNVILNGKVKPTEGELTLLQVLEKFLDNTYEVYFQPHANGLQPDIVVMRKGSGVLIIEVKDWHLNKSYHLNRGKWIVNNSNAVIKSPFAQVKNYKISLNETYTSIGLKSCYNSKYFGIIKTAVYFHNETLSSLGRFLSTDLNKKNFQYDNSYCLTRDCVNVAGINSLIGNSYLNSNSTFFNEELYNELKILFSPPFHTSELGKEVNYSKRQRELSTSVKGQFKIRGVAGSGKTLVLAKRAVNAVKRTEGKVLILCYNITLRNYIRDRISDVRENFSWSSFTIQHYHHFICEILNKLNVSVPKTDNFESADENFYSNVKLFEDLYSNSPRNQIFKGYDAIFIDEIQDYKSEWIKILKTYFLKPDGEFVVFGDEKQNLYGRELLDKKPNTSIPGRWNELNQSFRLSPKISELAKDFQRRFLINKYDLDNMDSLQLGFDFDSKIIYKNVDNITNTMESKETWEFLTALALETTSEYHKSDVCIITPSIKSVRNLDYFLKEKYKVPTMSVCETLEEYTLLSKGIPYIKSLEKENPTFTQKLRKIREYKRTIFNMGGGNLKISTIHSFKGWEIQTLVIVIDKSLDNDEYLYTALTRCKSKLIIINQGNKKYDDFFKSYAA